MILLSEYFLWLVVYSFIGWAYESFIFTVWEGRPVNRGFLTGPICPVYGIGALVAIAFLYQRTGSIPQLFLVGMLLTCTVEYITAILLEKLFHAKWWDYSNFPLNFQGRISLLGGLVFGTFIVLLIKYIHPVVSDSVHNLPDWVRVSLSFLIFIALMLDLVTTVRHLLLLNGRLQEIQSAMNGFVEQYAKRAEVLRDSLLDRFEESEFYSERIKTLFSLSRIQNIRLAKAFPQLRSIKYNDAWKKLKNILLGRENRQ